MENSEGVYLVHTRELRTLKENIYKIGRSHNLDNRVKQYPKKTIIILMINCENSAFCEKELIKLFKDKFIQQLEYGTEYFKGDEDLMIKEICNFINIFKENMKKEKKEKEKEEEEKKKEKKEKEKEKKNEKNKVKNEIKNKNNNKKDLDKKNNKNELSIDVKKTICPKCNHDFKYKSLLKTHFKNVYHCLLDEEQIKLFFNPIKNTIVCNKYNNCNKCNKNFNNIKALKRHNRETFCGKSQDKKPTTSNNSLSNEEMVNLINKISPKLVKNIEILINKKKNNNIII